MLSHFLRSMEDRLVTLIEIRLLIDAINESNGPKALEFAERLNQVGAWLLRDVRKPFKTLLQNLQEKAKALSPTERQRKTRDLFARLYESAERSVVVQTPSNGNDNQDQAIMNWINAARRSPGLFSESPPWAPSSESCVRMLRYEAMACREWQRWKRDYTLQTVDAETLEQTEHLEEILGTVLNALAQSRIPKGPAPRGRSDEVNSLQRGIELFASSYRLALQELRKRLNAPGRNAFGAEALASADFVAEQFDTNFALARKLLGLAEEWDRADLANASELLRQEWEQAEPLPDLPIGVDKGLKLRLLRDVCGYFDSNTKTSKPNLPRASEALREFARRLELPIRLILDDRDGPIQWSTDCDVTEKRRVKTGITLDSAENGPFSLQQAEWQEPAPARLLIDRLRKTQEVVSTSDPTLADACRDLAVSLAGHNTLAEWLAAGNAPNAEAGVERPKREWLVWSVVHLAATVGVGDSDETIGPVRAGEALLRALQEQGGIQLQTGDLSETMASPCWMVRRRLADGVVTPSTPSIQRRRGIWITLPDAPNTPIAPPALATFDDSSPTSSPFAREWQELQPYLSELKIRDPEASTWQDFDAIFLEGQVAADESAQAALFRLFQASHPIMRRAGVPAQGLWRHVLRTVHRRLSQLERPIVPYLSTTNLAPLPAEQQPVDVLRLKWKRSPKPAGTILDIQAFGCGATRAQATASGGESFNESLSRFFDMPELPASDEVDRRLEEIRETIELNCRDPNNIAKQLEADLRGLVSWLNHADQRDTLNSWLHSVRESTTRRQWYALLCQTGNLRTYPQLDPATCELRLQPEAIGGAAGILWQFSDELPFGQLLDEATLRFSTSLGGVEGHFSLGTCEEGSIFAAADSLENEIPTGPSLSRGADPLRAFASKSREIEIRRRLGGNAIPDESCFKLLCAAADHLEQTSDWTAAERDRALSSLRSIATSWNGRITPVEFRFSTSEAILSVAKPMFHPPEGKIGVKLLFGIHCGQFGRDEKVYQYVGPEPQGWRELKQAVDSKTLPEAVRQEIEQKLGDWPRQYQKQNLIQKVVELHMQWHDQMRTGVAKVDEAAARAVTDALERVVRGQGLKLFLASTKEPLPRNPAKYVEITYAQASASAQGHSSTGILEILRPGIQDGTGEPKCKARIVMSESNS